MIIKFPYGRRIEIRAYCVYVENTPEWAQPEHVSVTRGVHGFIGNEWHI
jgi:hypothetical protein